MVVEGFEDVGNCGSESEWSNKPNLPFMQAGGRCPEDGHYPGERPAAEAEHYHLEHPHDWVCS